MQEPDFPFANNNNKRRGGNCFSSSVSNHKKPRTITKTALIDILNLGIPLLSSTTGLPNRSCDFLFDNRLVSKQHCQILFDCKYRKIYILDGAILSRSVSSSSVVDEFRRRLLCANELEKETEIVECFRVKVSLNGVYVNGFGIGKGMVRELFSGDEVLLVCGSEGVCSLGMRIGFVIQGIFYKEVGVFGSSEMGVERPRLLGTLTSSGHSQGAVSSGKGSKRVFALRENDIMSPGSQFSRFERGDAITKVNFILSWCRHILHSNDLISCIIQCAISDCGMKCRYGCSSELLGSKVGNLAQVSVRGPVYGKERPLCDKTASEILSSLLICKGKNLEASMADGKIADDNVSCNNLCQEDTVGGPHEIDVASDHHKTSLPNSVGKENIPLVDCVGKGKSRSSCPTPGKKFVDTKNVCC